MFEVLKPLISEEEIISLAQIYQNAKTIHSDRILFSYTDHGVNHSNRILQNLLKLFPELFEVNYSKRLSPTEVFCLVASIYLHDIGIQLYKADFLEKYCEENGIKNSDINDKELFIRKYHHDLSRAWIEDSISKKQRLPDSYVGDKTLAPYIAKICESHGTDFESDNKYTKEAAYNGDRLRMGLLCTLLSLGDALDCDNRRIIYQKLKNEEISVKSRIHWMKHYYVDSVCVDKGCLELFYNFPKDINPEDKELYIFYFQNKTRCWLEKKNEKRLRILLKAHINYDVVQKVDFNGSKDKLSDEEFDAVKSDTSIIINEEIDGLNKLKQRLRL